MSSRSFSSTVNSVLKQSMYWAGMLGTEIDITVKPDLVIVSFWSEGESPSQTHRVEIHGGDETEVMYFGGHSVESVVANVVTSASAELWA